MLSSLQHADERSVCCSAGQQLCFPGIRSRSVGCYLAFGEDRWTYLGCHRFRRSFAVQHTLKKEMH